MHIYIYDDFLGQKKYDNILAQIEIRITDLGLNGKISRMGAMKNIRATVENEIKKGAKTIIAVGNDNTVNQVACAVAGSQVPMGIIPIGSENLIAGALGVGRGVEACDVLAARRLEKLDIAIANNNCFLTSATITSKGTVLKIKNECSLEITETGEFNIVNLITKKDKFPKELESNPKDGILELFINTKSRKKFSFFKDENGRPSIFSLKTLSVYNNKDLPLVLDNSVAIKTPVEINILKQKLNIIVGKDRVF